MLPKSGANKQLCNKTRRLVFENEQGSRYNEKVFYLEEAYNDVYERIKKVEMT
ncbi:MAG TPA: hypothetical protein VIM16_12655 [Mucilaginibacter sp.]|jgi:hypothetical protein